MSTPLHERTCDIQTSPQTRVRLPISHFDSRRYVQHNVRLEDGLAPILALMDALPADRTRVAPLRAFTDGDFSVGHFDYVLGDWGPMVGFEIHRWDDDRIVEHWDNLQATPTAPNASGRTMIDGAAAIADPDRTEANKALILAFTTDVLIGGRRDRIGDFHDGTALVQHNPGFGDGTDRLAGYLETGHGTSAAPIYRRLHLLLGQGNFVLAASEGEAGGLRASRQPAAFYDLYRIEDGGIAEHWDVIETIPPRGEWKNDNGKF